LSGRSRTKRRLIIRSVLYKAAVLVVVSVLLALCLSGAVFAVDLTLPNSLTVNIQDGFKDDEGLKDENLIVDLYRVADARNDIPPAKGYDTYTLVTTEAFSSLQAAIDNAQIADSQAKERWDQVAQQAVTLVRAGKGGAPIATGHTGDQISDLQAGLYLVLTHGTTEPYYYDNEGKGPVLTMARTPRYEYHFLPQMIAFPFVASDEGAETFNTADARGDWKNDLTVVFKSEREEPETPEDKPETGDKSGLFAQKIIFTASGICILLIAVIIIVKRKRGEIKR